MPRFRTKIHEVEAIQLRHPVTVPSSDSTNPNSQAFDVPAGTWLVVDGEGSQSYVPDEQFSAVYEAVPPQPRRGRPPGKVTSIGEGEAPHRKRHRKRHKQAA